MDIEEPPFLLCSVCSRWRQLALNTPRLWSTLHIWTFNPPLGGTEDFWTPPERSKQLAADSENLFPPHYATVKDWIDRSGVLPLEISINLGGHDPQIPESHNNLILPYFDILFSCCRRWKRLDLRIPSKLYTTILPSIQSLSFPKLEYLNIAFPPGDRVPLDLWKKSGIFNATRLSAICLFRFPFPPSSLSIDWSRFTQVMLVPGSNSIGIGKVSLKEAFEILRSCHRLRHCGLAIGDGPDASSPRAALPLAMLESLILIDDALQLESLIECLEIPSLQEITYFTTFPPTTSIQRRSPLISLLTITNGRVTSLTTSLQFFTLQDLLKCLILVPHQ